jgi:hypothetical protein
MVRCADGALGAIGIIFLFIIDRLVRKDWKRYKGGPPSAYKLGVILVALVVLDLGRGLVYLLWSAIVGFEPNANSPDSGKVALVAGGLLLAGALLMWRSKPSSEETREPFFVKLVHGADTL